MTQHYDAVCVGGGFAGIYHLYMLRKLGFNVHLFDAAPDFGGIWRLNCYPGARVDSEVPLYGLSFPEVWRSWNFSCKYPDFKELRQYFNHLDEKLELRKDCSFNHRVRSAHWDDAAQKWTLTAGPSEDKTVTVTAQHVIFCLGFASKVNIPKIPGMEKFKGKIIHTRLHQTGTLSSPSQAQPPSSSSSTPSTPPARSNQTANMPGQSGKVLLAYSGGLDTSTILAWLIDEGYDVIAFMADVGQEEDFEAARSKALKCGAKDFILADLKREFIEELIFPAVQANAIYEDVYLLGTSLARPVIARGMIEAADKTGCQYVSHGCTGKGNDQVRFELAFYGLKPDIKVIAPWRIPEFFNRFAGRSALLEYAESKGIPVTQTKAKPWSTDENLFHISYEAGILEDPNTTPPADMWKLTKSPETAPDTPENIVIEFQQGIPSKVKVASTGKEHTDPVDVFLTLNQLAREHGIGRIDIVENRFIGVKSRGCYESPGATILRAAHLDLEGLTLDREVRRIRDQVITTKFSEQLYYGFFFSPECEFVRSCIPQSQKTVNGQVKLKLYKGNVIVEGRSSEELLYDEKFTSMDEQGGFDSAATSGFITVQAIRLRRYGLGLTERGQAGSDRQTAYAIRK